MGGGEGCHLKEDDVCVCVWVEGFGGLGDLAVGSTSLDWGGIFGRECIDLGLGHIIV